MADPDGPDGPDGPGEPDAPDRPDARDLLWVPVRHHSPAAALAVRDLVAAYRPAAVLVEGPADYTRIDQLLLDHRLPVSLMAWLRWEPEDDDEHPVLAHALYPFARFSPEWQAITQGARAGADVRFVDLPWHEQFWLEQRGRDEAAALLPPDEVGEAFYDRLAAYTGRHDLSAVWDEFVEVEPDVDAATYLRRAAVLGAGMRADAVAGEERDRLNRAREQHMAAEVLRARADHPSGVVLVVTGAFHTTGLQRLVAAGASARPPAPPPTHVPPGRLESGHALLPTSYAVLDAHAGYLAGQPSPGFYDRVYDAGLARRGGATDRDDVAAGLLAESVTALRGAGVVVSAADAIAATTTARGLAAVRDHARVWRDDLVDGLTSALVKDVLVGGDHAADGGHPLVGRLRHSLRGDAVGRLAPGTDQPPLVADVLGRCEAAGIPLEPTARVVHLDLDDAADRRRSRLLHTLAVLDIPAAVLERDATTGDAGRPTGSGRPGGARPTGRLGSTQVWRVRWSERVATASVTASRYGALLDQALRARLAEEAREGIAALTGVLEDAVRCGVEDLRGDLADRITSAVRATDELLDLRDCLGLLLRLHRFDRWYGVTGRADLGALLVVVATRAVELVERLPPVGGGAAASSCAAVLRQVTEAVLSSPELHAAGLEEQLRAAVDAQLGDARGGAARRTRRTAEERHAPEVEGALTGARWLLDSVVPAADRPGVGPAGAPDPVATGAWYAGLMAVAGHLALAAPQLFDPLDAALRAWSADDFVQALPDLRRATAELVPAERQALLRHLVPTDAVPLAARAPLQADPAALAALVAREAELFGLVERHVGPLGAPVARGGDAG
ncbi:DUF5682 family protein [Nocardioides sp. CPCC 205120]|uniref:DUF5682 family protein n=1 Tax=Nocardioides sp. CPCC 205120 TaxID=3406462 RepID=UPI003B506792